MKDLMKPIEMILKLNDSLFVNALYGVSDEQANQRISEHSNPLCWIAAHTVSARYLMLLFLGKPMEDPYKPLFENFRGYNASVSYPSLENVKEEWRKVSELISSAMSTVTDEQLGAESVMKSPIGDNSNFGTLAFMAQHESYDVGQMAFLKKFHTVEAMKYS